jgi:hypothetical protein
MRIPLLLLSLALLPGLAAAAAVAPAGAPPGTKSEHQMVEGVIERVFERIDGEFHYLAYQVTYQGSVIVVPVMFPQQARKVGDTVKYLAMKAEIPQEGMPPVRQVTFMCMEAMHEWPTGEAVHEARPAAPEKPAAP